MTEYIVAYLVISLVCVAVVLLVGVLTGEDLDEVSHQKLIAGAALWPVAVPYALIWLAARMFEAWRDADKEATDD